jgi:hyperosmotically inducible periplasmic protein
MRVSICLFLTAFALTRVIAEPVRDERMDAWIEGRLSTAYLLNARLNPIGLVVDVRDCVVTLRGSVESAVDHELVLRVAGGIEEVAELVARNVDGVEGVRNLLDVGNSRR